MEFVAQREMAEKVATEETALRNIEELADLGAIKGVYGRLKKLIKVERGYQTSSRSNRRRLAWTPWLSKTYDAAFTCAETLKRMKLGRIKIIPIEEMSEINSVNIPSIRGINGTASNFVKTAKKYEPAVKFVFGDTIVTRRPKNCFCCLTKRQQNSHSQWRPLRATRRI